MPRATIFINASSGWDPKEEAPQLIEKLFEAASIDTDVHYVKAGANLAQLSREAVASGSSIVVAGGGDGTLSAVAAGLVGTDTAFGVLPVGTLNHFARDLKLPLDLESAAKIVLAGETTDVDVGEVNGKTFLNNSILGLYPIYRFLKAEEQKKGWGSKAALLKAAIAVFRRFPSLKLRLHVNGQELVRKSPYVLIANNEHGMEGYHLGLRRSLNEGKLWIYVMRRRGRLALLGLLLRIVFGRFKGRDAFEIFQAEEVWVESAKRGRLGVALDGEVTVMESPLRYRVLPRSLRVLVPPQENAPPLRPVLTEEAESALRPRRIVSPEFA